MKEDKAKILKEIAENEKYQQEELDQIEQRVESTVHQIQEIKAENEYLQNQNENFKNNNINLNEKLTSLEEKYEKTKSELRKLMRENSRMNFTINRKEQDMKRSIGIVKHGERKKEKKVKMFDDLKSLIASYKNKIN